MDEKYYYENTKVLKNKLNILNKEKLAAAEKDIVALKLYDITVRQPKKYLDYAYLKRLHRHLYGDIYSWAGKERNSIISSEGVSIIGVSASFSYPGTITPVLNTILSEAGKVKIDNMDLKGKVDHFSKLVSDIWRVHPFNHGNTITTLAFADQYARYNGISFDYQTLIDNMPYTKKALTLYTNGAYGESDYLNVIIKDAIRNDLEKKKYINPEAIEKEIIKAGYTPTPFLVDNIEKLNLRFSKIHTIKDIKELYKSPLKLEEKERLIVNDISKAFQIQEIRKIHIEEEKKLYSRTSVKETFQAEL